ncbi:MULTISPECIES: S-layer family protein [unclassified Rhizobacter]|uniref:beta strand repeat-containing protein n=1 Tax=unclassified Rhizobacter TaxID=2640088 RepID=UPI0007018750|nr:MULTISPECIES: calcium-binding protein [unclassified Rhizobacter]KQU80611.1 hypothetical protein ASC88_13595 [Rhizobacter sp. Root29]KQW09706.1 hypothetical protein ASC98_23705 [Rhizobacter sp. Root1238]KRB14734.1 hypothetical protein ASE08_09975 [Rhizobacter sp. Root16D2]
MSTQSTVGDAGDNTLTGSTKSEEFTGGKGSDTVIYAAGGGQDTLLATYDTTAGKVDTLQLNGIAPENLQFSRDGNDLVIGFRTSSTDRVTVKYFFLGDDPGSAFNPMQRITFVDPDGEPANPAIVPFSFAKIIQVLATGGAGDDDLRGTALADTLIGGAGNDTLTGGKGNDQYQFNPGDGQDVIASTSDSDATRVDTLRLGTGLSPDRLSFSSTGSGGTSLLIRFADSTDQITVENFLSGDKTANNYSPLQRITFADDATQLKAADILAALYGGTAGADNQHGTGGNDSITGLAGNDVIDARAGNDTLVGGAGDDTLNGGTGNDDYRYTRGDGNDLIKLQNDTSSGKLNTLHFSAGIVAADVTLTRSGSSLLIGITGQGTIPASTIAVENFCFTAGSDSSFNPLQQIVFDGVQASDGNALRWNLTTMQAGFASDTGSSNSSNQPATGPDLLTGTVGADTLVGGTGNDTLDAGMGNDTCVFNPGDGHDTILATQDTTTGRVDTLQLNGIVSTNLTLTRSDGDLVIGFKDKSGDSITVKRFFLNDDPYNACNPLQQITFKSADGTTAQSPVGSLGIAQILTAMATGTAGNDRLRGTAGNDTLIGHAGDDTLIGGNGDDVIEFTVGDGKDLVAALTQDARPNRNDTLLIHGTSGKTAITADMLTLGTSGTSLVIQVGSADDRITVENFFFQDDPHNGYNPLQAIVFDDTTRLDVTTILAKLHGGTAANDALRGTSGGDTITGLAGNDTIDGRGGDDRIDGGAGNDLIDGGKGNDTIWFGVGDGQDTLQAAYDSTSGRTDTLMLKSDIVEADLTLTRSGADLIISVHKEGATTTDTITVKNFSFAPGSDTSYNPLQAITFAGVKTAQKDAQGDFIDLGWKLSDIQGKVGGSGSGGPRTGSDEADTIKGTDGNDLITGNGGNDTIDGGKGNDTYVFNTGDGSDVLSVSRDTTIGRNDTLQLSDITSLQATFTRSGSDLIIGMPVDPDTKVHSDQITVKGFYLLNDPSNSYNPLQSIEFSDDTKDRAWIIAQANIGTSGNDRLVGTVGADRLEGGKGDDTLIGGQGNDTYTFNVGDGRDTITSTTSDSTLNRKDTLNLVGTNLSKANLVLETSGSSLIIGLAGNITDQITVTNFLASDTASNKSNPLQAITFNGSNELDLDGILDKLYEGTTGADSLRGTVDADSITGGAGDDTLDGRAGNDTLYGGTGNDTITGGSGNNVYAFHAGDGQDLLKSYTDTSRAKDSTLKIFGYGTDDIVVTKLKTTLVLSFNAKNATNTDKITVSNFDFTGGGNDYNPLQNIYFASSDTTWTGTAGIVKHITGITVSGNDQDNGLSGNLGDDTLTGGAGDDTLYGLAGDDQLTGGLGDDVIDGGDGNDTYCFDHGDGNDTLVGTPDSSSDLDTLAFGTGLDLSDLALTRVGTSLVTYTDKKTSDNTDQITVEDFSFSSGDDTTSNPLQAITSSSGNWDLAAIRGKVAGLARTGDSGANTLRGADLKDTLDGGAGDDALFGYGGDDDLTGGAGNDWVNGGDGDDTYHFNSGDGSDTLSGSADSNTAVNNTLALNGSGSNVAMLTRIGTSLVIYMNTSADDTDQITVEDFSFSAGDGNTSNPLQAIDWSGTSNDWNLERIRTEVSGLRRGGNELANTVRGGDLNDTLAGEDGNDTLVGYAGNDDLTGGKGDDSVNGGEGNDTYHFAPGEGNDTIVDSGGDDTLSMAASNALVYFKQDGDDLDIYTYSSGTSTSAADVVRVDDWFLSTDHQIESIVTTVNGTHTLSSTDVASLVTAMADFDLPATGAGLSATDGWNDVLTAIGKYWKS